MEIATWQDYLADKSAGEHTVSGDVKIFKDLYSPQLANQRDVLVYLPADYATGAAHYPVIYMHDAQNLFDAHTSFAGEWQVDETLLALEPDGIAAIAVGLANIGPERLNEYSPFHNPRLGGGKGAAYLDFIVQTVKPLIDSQFRTRPDRDHTGLIGSSMGGLISLYGFFSQPQTFGFAGVLSPALWFADRAIFPYIQQQPYHPGRLYLDMGTAEYSTSRWQKLVPTRIYNPSCSDTRRLYADLTRKGYQPDRDIRYIEATGAGHNETAWARRLPDALRFLLR